VEQGKTVLLNQLRIERADRTDSPRDPTVRGRSRLWWVSGTVVAGAVAATAIWFLGFAREGVSVRAVVAQPAAVSGTSSTGGSLLDATGYVVALREATVSGKSIYKVNEVLVQEGQPVKQGQVMARLDDTNARAALEQSKAQVKQLEATLAAARLAADDARPIFFRSQKQVAGGLISQDTFDAAKANHDAIEAAVAVAEENLAVARANVEVNQRYEDDTVIKAPFDGVVTVKTAQPGEIVSPQFSGGGGIAKIVDMDSLEVDVDVSENYIHRVRPQQPATITLNAYPEWRIPAEVIAVIPTADRAKATVKVRIGFKVKDPRIVPEMGAHVSFLENAPQSRSESRPTTPGVIVPPEAIQASGETGIAFVIVGDRLERRIVKLGARTSDDQTILSGIQPGATLAAGELDKLRDGLRVHVVH
jgi:RND family efflux transporter MFP subunit